MIGAKEIRDMARHLLDGPISNVGCCPHECKILRKLESLGHAKYIGGGLGFWCCTKTTKDAADKLEKKGLRMGSKTENTLDLQGRDGLALQTGDTVTNYSCWREKVAVFVGMAESLKWGNDCIVIHNGHPCPVRYKDLKKVQE